MQTADEEILLIWACYQMLYLYLTVRLADNLALSSNKKSQSTSLELINGTLINYL